MEERRGRPKQEIKETPEKYTREFYEVPSKPELGWKSVWHYDVNKSTSGPWKTEHFPVKGEKHPKPKIQKNQTYGGLPIVMVFKTSNRSNAQTKIKVWKNTNIDYIVSADKLPGVPDKAVILELGVGKNFEEKWKSEYNL